jgi:predicted kinase
MELIMLIGIPGSGKSSFYKTYFFNTYVRVSLDLLNTRNKEKRFMALAFALQQRMVLDNTNVTKAERAQYIHQAMAHKFAVTGYYFESQLSVCLDRNENRTGKEKIDRVGVIAKHKALELPGYAEGFDKLYYVAIENDRFKINDWKDEI